MISQQIRLWNQAVLDYVIVFSPHMVDPVKDALKQNYYGCSVFLTCLENQHVVAYLWLPACVFHLSY